MKLWTCASALSSSIPPYLHTFTLILTLFLLAVPRGAAGQDGTAGSRFIQSGIAVLPGLGVEAGYVRARSIATIEGMLYVDISPGFAGGEGNVQVSAGLGGALRPLGVVRTIGNANYTYDFDIGLRFGPSLFFATNATRSDKNQQFRFILEPFLRFNTRLASGRILFVEAGTLSPVLRAGLWFRL